MSTLRSVTRWRVIAMAMGTVMATLALVPGPSRAAQQVDDDPCAAERQDPLISWENVTPPDARRAGDLKTFFLDAQTGWVVGRRGQIFRTVDGGATWLRGAERTPAPPQLSPGSLKDVFFIDKKRGWIVGQDSSSTNPDNPGFILYTEDGGEFWDRQDVEPVAGTPFEGEARFDLTSVSSAKDPVTGSTLGWAIGTSADGTDHLPDRGVLLRTDDGGRTWIASVPDPGRPARVFKEMTFVNANDGYALSGAANSAEEATPEDGAIFATKDGGDSWSVDLPNPDPRGGTEFAALSSTRAGNAHAWFNHGDDEKGAWAKTNGGSWKQQDACPLHPLSEFAFVDGRNCPLSRPGCNGIGGGYSGGDVITTRDDGEHWTRDLPLYPVETGTHNPGGDRQDAIFEIFDDLSYPHPTVAYAVVYTLPSTQEVYKATITFVQVTEVEAKDGGAKGLLCGGTEVEVTGDHFYPKDKVHPASAVWFGDQPAEALRIERGSDPDKPDDKLLVKAPPGVAPGKVPVIVETEGLGRSLPSAEATFEYVDPALLPPMVRGLSSKEGKLAGGGSLTISGERLACARSVDFRDPRSGTVARVQGPRVLPSGDIAVDLPPWVEPSSVDVPVDVVVTTAGLAGVPVPSVPESPGADDFTYLATPAISAVDPPRGSALGGTKVTIKGTSFEQRAGDAKPEVIFGDADATEVSVGNDGRTITATLPPHAPGPVRVKVSTTRRGASVPVPQFTYHPGISGIFPPTGPITGGTEVTIAGKGFASTTEVRFGNDAVKFTERSDTELVAVAPPHAIAEAVPVTLVASGLSSLPEDVVFTYGLVPPVEEGPDGDTAGGPIDEQPPGVQTAPPGGSPAASPSLSSAPSPVPSGSPVPGGAGAAGASAAPGASAGQAPSSVNAPVGAALPVPLASPVAAPGAAGHGAPGSGQGAVSSEDNDEAQGARRYAMTDASARLALGGAGAAGCFTWLVTARLGAARRRRASPAGRARPKTAY